MDLPDLVVLVLASWRISLLLASEHGPYDIMDMVRHKAGVRYDENSAPYGTNVVSSSILCMWCNSFWVGMSIAIALLIGVPVWVFLPLALSAGVIFLERMLS